MRNVLQKQGVNSATAASIRVAPTFNATDYHPDSVALGMNDTVKTINLDLDARSTRDFYFNTQYLPAN